MLKISINTFKTQKNTFPNKKTRSQMNYSNTNTYFCSTLADTSYVPFLNYQFNSRPANFLSSNHKSAFRTVPSDHKQLPISLVMCPLITYTVAQSMPQNMFLFHAIANQTEN